MDFNSIIEVLMPWIIGLIMVLFIVGFVKKIFSGMRRPKEELNPSNTGERLKKYIYNSSKGNPRIAKTIWMMRSPYSSGGLVGHIVGAMPTRHCTRFLIKNHKFQRWGYKLLYCPTSMHSSLHAEQIMLNAAGLDNAGGFYYPIPLDGDNYKTFRLVADAVRIDLKKMEIMDIMQVEYDQTISAIAGEEKTEDFIYDSQEEMEPEYIEQPPPQEGDY